MADFVLNFDRLRLGTLRGVEGTASPIGPHRVTSWRLKQPRLMTFWTAPLWTNNEKETTNFDSLAVTGILVDPGLSESPGRPIPTPSEPRRFS
jgi:hypothetical protein